MSVRCLGAIVQAAKTAGGPTRVEKAKIGLIQFHLSPPKADIENTVVISDYAQVNPVVPFWLPGAPDSHWLATHNSAE
jgi:hypothetical protein